jgi:hypothetical protein
MIRFSKREAFFVGRKALVTFYLVVFVIASLALSRLVNLVSVIWKLFR